MTKGHVQRDKRGVGWACPNKSGVPIRRPSGNVMQVARRNESGAQVGCHLQKCTCGETSAIGGVEVTGLDQLTRKTVERESLGPPAPSPAQLTLEDGLREVLEQPGGCWPHLDWDLIPDHGQLCLLRVHLQISLFLPSVCPLVSPCKM